MLAQPSVGATENLLMAAALADGETVIANAAREPEIVDLAALPHRHGRADRRARARATSRSRACRGCTAAATAIIPDRIEAGTYAMAAAITGGRVLLKNAPARASSAPPTEKLRRRACGLEATDGGVQVGLAEGGLRGSDVMTRPFPGFATDLQAQFMALMCVAEGAAMITETIFENRFMHVPGARPDGRAHHRARRRRRWCAG